MEQRGTLRIDKAVVDFAEREALDGIDLCADSFWGAFEELVQRFTPRNRELLEVRERMQLSLIHI